MSGESAETIVDPALTPTPEPPVDPPPETPSEPSPRMIPADVLVREVTPLRAKNRELESALDEHRRQLNEARDLITRMQNGKGGDQTPPSPRQPDQPQLSQADVERAAIQLNFQRDAGRVSEAGIGAYGRQNWADACNLMESFGLNSADFVHSVMEIGGLDKTHQIFHAIAQEPEKAVALAQMSPARRIAEITRISERMTAKPAAAAQPTEPAKPAARTVSRAPDPAPRVEPSASRALDWQTDQDKMSDAEWSQNWNERYAKRQGRR